jgi:hypothetical protein
VQNKLTSSVPTVVTQIEQVVHPMYASKSEAKAERYKAKLCDQRLFEFTRAVTTIWKSARRAITRLSKRKKQPSNILKSDTSPC